MKRITILILAMMVTICGFSQSRVTIGKELRNKSQLITSPIPETLFPSVVKS